MWTIVRAVTLRQKLQINSAISASQSILTPNQPAITLDLITPGAWCQLRLLVYVIRCGKSSTGTGRFDPELALVGTDALPLGPPCGNVKVPVVGLSTPNEH